MSNKGVLAFRKVDRERERNTTDAVVIPRQVVWSVAYVQRLIDCAGARDNVNFLHGVDGRTRGVDPCDRLPRSGGVCVVTSNNAEGIPVAVEIVVGALAVAFAAFGRVREGERRGDQGNEQKSSEIHDGWYNGDAYAWEVTMW